MCACLCAYAALVCACMMLSAAFLAYLALDHVYRYGASAKRWQKDGLRSHAMIARSPLPQRGHRGRLRIKPHPARLLSRMGLSVGMKLR